MRVSNLEHTRPDFVLFILPPRRVCCFCLTTRFCIPPRSVNGMYTLFRADRKFLQNFVVLRTAALRKVLASRRGAVKTLQSGLE